MTKGRAQATIVFNFMFVLFLILRLQTETNYGKALTAVKVGSRVGVLVDTASCLHLYVDGHDQGVAYSGVKQPCYAMFDLYAFFKKVPIWKKRTKNC